MAANVDTAPAGMERCVSCNALLSGPYCSRCGERTLEPEALTLRHFLVHTVAHELLNVDGALWRTLRLLFVHPGRLSLEYAAGRRRPLSQSLPSAPHRDRRLRADLVLGLRT